MQVIDARGFLGTTQAEDPRQLYPVFLLCRCCRREGNLVVVSFL